MVVLVPVAAPRPVVPVERLLPLKVAHLEVDVRINECVFAVLAFRALLFVALESLIPWAAISFRTSFRSSATELAACSVEVGIRLSRMADLADLGAGAYVDRLVVIDVTIHGAE